jgi:hypothetical protein
MNLKWLSTYDEQFNWEEYLNIPVYAVIEYSDKVAWGDDDITPVIRHLYLEKCDDHGAEYRWKILDPQDKEERKFPYVPQDMNVVMVKIIKNE